jgi:hypothetical protein
MTNLRIDTHRDRGARQARASRQSSSTTFPNCRPIDFTTFADHLNEDGSQRFCRIL